MSDRPVSLITPNPWEELRRHTRARIALGRAGNSLPTAELLRFGVAHAQARDAVHLPLDVERLHADLVDRGVADILRVRSAAPDRQTYLLRPDLGRALDPADQDRLGAVAQHGADVVFVIADGLSSLGVQRHAAPLLAAVLPLLSDWRIGPLVLVEQGRVAIGDAIGAALGARMVVVLIGERPGLSSPDSLGLYLTRAPRVGRTDAERNCISNVRDEGLTAALAARKLVWLMQAARRLGLTGVGLKDNSDPAGNARIS